MMPTLRLTCLVGLGLTASTVFGCSAKPRSFTVQQALDAASADGGYSVPQAQTPEDAALPGIPLEVAADAGLTLAPSAVDAMAPPSPIEAGASIAVDSSSAVDAAAVSAIALEAAAPAPVEEAGAQQPSTPPDGAAPPVVAECGQPSDCDDGNLCNGGEGCSNGRCVSGRNVDDGQQCELVGAELALLCSLGSCTPSECGDGFLDERTGEVCDDANDVAADGCEANCTFTCTQDEDCSDGEACNGAEHCELESHTCSGGEALPDQTPCGDAAECYSARCLPADCGDGVLSSTEACDDNNLQDGDGCDADCTYTCLEDADCHDGNVCNGTELCEPETHACIRVDALSCNDGSTCSNDLCDPVTGCHYPTVDHDGDGQASSELGTCGSDCDDDNATVYVGAGELCDGLDNDCNGQVDEIATTWYRDCDGDGFAPAKAEGVQSCEKPGPPPGCERGQVATWTATASSGAAIDCWDKDANVNPTVSSYQVGPIAGRAAAVDYDYNCDGREELKAYTENTARLACNGGIIVDPIPIDPPILQPAAVALCMGTAGWVRSGPQECGEPGAWSVCKRVDGVCGRHATERTQDCR